MDVDVKNTEYDSIDEIEKEFKKRMAKEKFIAELLTINLVDGGMVVKSNLPNDPKILTMVLEVLKKIKAIIHKQLDTEDSSEFSEMKKFIDKKTPEEMKQLLKDLKGIIKGR